MFVLPGQGDNWQTFCSRASPVQLAPPNCGMGLLHVLCLFWVPFPHVTVHSVHSDQSDQPPSTMKEQSRCKESVHLN